MPLLPPLQDPGILFRVDVERFLILFLDGDRSQLWRSRRVPTRWLVLRDPSATLLVLLVSFVVVVVGRGIEGGGGLVGLVVVVGGGGRGEGVVEGVGRGWVVSRAMDGGRRKGRSSSGFSFVGGGEEGRLGELVMGQRVAGRRSGEGRRKGRGGRLVDDEIMVLERRVDGRV